MSRSCSLSILVFILLLVAGGCVKNEVKLTFEVSGEVNTVCRILYYASDKRGGMIRETVAEIAGGKGEITLPQRNPSLIFLFSPAHSMPDAVIYARRGDNLKITGEGDDVAAWNIEGNDITGLLSKWRIENLNDLRSRDTEKINGAVARFVEDNLRSGASAVLLYVYFDRRDHESEFFRLQSLLDSNVLNDTDLINSLAAGDLMGDFTETPSYPSSIILHGMSGFADTLVFSKNKATLLVFHKEKEKIGDFYPDSVKKILERKKGYAITEIFVDSDSLGWNRHLRKDTIESLGRMWMPLGLADSVAIEMGVRRLPYYIILDSAAKEVLRGGDSGMIMQTFENLKP